MTKQPPIPTDAVEPDRSGGDPDWLRQFSWNLPTKTDEFLDTLGIKPTWALRTQRRRVARFMQTTAARAMPANIRAGLRRRSLL